MPQLTGFVRVGVEVREVVGVRDVVGVRVECGKEGGRWG